MNIERFEKEVIAEHDVSILGESLSAYKVHLRDVVTSGGYEQVESSIVLPSDTQIHEQVARAVKWSKQDALKYVIVVGIGGSNLGAEAIYDALGAKNGVELLFLDTTSSHKMNNCIALLDEHVTDKDEVLVNVISKSGTTTETIANFEILYEYLEKRFKSVADRVIATTDEGSELWQIAQEKDFYTLPIPAMVGGRYSVFSAVGLLPLALIGLSIDDLLQGAREVRDNALGDGSEVMGLAVGAFSLFQRGYVVHNTFVFDERLESIGKWWRQLVGESLGKSKTTTQEDIAAGIIPIVSVGSTDLHSVGQLYLSATRDILTTFVRVTGDGEYRVPENAVTASGAKLGHKSLSDIKDAIYQGTVAAYKEKALPIIEITLDSMSEYELGAYMQLKMLEVMFLAKLLEINAFDQPNVEDYKKVTRELLK